MIKKIIILCRGINLSKPYFYINLLLYIIFSVLNGIFESFSLLILTQYFTGIDIIGFDKFFANILFSNYYFSEKIILLLLLSALVCKIIIIYLDGWFNIKLRTSIQGSLFNIQLSSSWLRLRSHKIGALVAIISQEALLTAKYLSSWISAFFNTIVIISISIICMLIDYKSSLMLWLTSVPLLILIRYLYKVQSHFSIEASNSRSNFASTVSEYYSGLHQIKIEDNADRYINNIDNIRFNIDTIESKINAYQSIISSYSLISITFTFLIIYIITSIYGGIGYEKSSILAVGILSLKLSSYFSSLIASFGNINRLVGSFLIVFHQFEFYKPIKKITISSKISSISVYIKGFNFFNNDALNREYKFIVDIGRPLIIKGPSGVGKTTLANIISGIIDDDNSIISYIDMDNRIYNSKSYKLKIGYVSQDIHLFSGTFKENLDRENQFTDSEISEVLNMVDALSFVNSSGGLYAAVSEAGYNLSGGQKRRLGIARALLSKSNIFIFDEITSGLDIDNTNMIYNLINTLSKENIVILITHDQYLNLDNSVTINLK